MCGDKGSRTPDLCGAIAALYQLSYVPVGPMQTSTSGDGSSEIAVLPVDKRVGRNGPSSIAALCRDLRE